MVIVVGPGRGAPVANAYLFLSRARARTREKDSLEGTPSPLDAVIAVGPGREVVCARTQAPPPPR